MSRMGAASFSVAPRFDVDMERHRRQLTGYCYRMLGAGSEAEDAVQETFRLAFVAALQHLPPRQRAVPGRARCSSSSRW